MSFPWWSSLQRHTTPMNPFLNRRIFLSTMVAISALALFPGGVTGADAIKMRQLYNKDLSFSKLALTLADSRITVQGFMAPPLKANASFFVLTKMPMAVCPFCETDADWPDDILAIYTKRVTQIIAFNIGIEVRGILRLGSYTDPDNGFVSQIRLVDANYTRQ